MNKKILFLFFLVIFSLKFFDAAFLKDGVLKYVSYGYMLLAILLSLPYFFKYKGGFVLPVQIISISVFISVFMAYFTWGQSLSYSTTTIPYMIWFVFFLLMHSKISIRSIEKIVIIYGVIYVLLFAFQFMHTNIVYFGSRDIVMDRGVMRIVFPGGGVFFLSCFMSINKFTSNKRYKYLWLSFALVGIVVIVLQVTRQTILALLFIYLIHLTRNLKTHYKILASIVFVGGFYLFFISNNEISRGIVEQQKTDSSFGNDYIRVSTSKYFLTQFNPSAINNVFGNGLANETTRYGKVMRMISDNWGYFLSDVGFVEVFILYGIFAVFGFVIIFYKSFIINVPNNFQYLKYYIWVLLFTSFTSDFLLSYNFLISTVFVLYIYQKLYYLETVESFVKKNKSVNVIHNRYPSVQS